MVTRRRVAGYLGLLLWAAASAPNGAAQSVSDSACVTPAPALVERARGYLAGLQSRSAGTVLAAATNIPIGIQMLGDTALCGRIRRAADDQLAGAPHPLVMDGAWFLGNDGFLVVGTAGGSGPARRLVYLLLSPGLGLIHEDEAKP